MESEIISWANKRLEDGGKNISIKSFQDKVNYVFFKNLKTIFFILLGKQDCPPHHPSDWSHEAWCDRLQHCQAGREHQWTGKNCKNCFSCSNFFLSRTACPMLSIALPSRERLGLQSMPCQRTSARWSTRWWWRCTPASCWLTSTRRCRWWTVSRQTSSIFLLLY